MKKGHKGLIIKVRGISIEYNSMLSRDMIICIAGLIKQKAISEQEYILLKAIEYSIKNQN